MQKNNNFMYWIINNIQFSNNIQLFSKHIATLILLILIVVIGYNQVCSQTFFQKKKFVAKLSSKKRSL